MTSDADLVDMLNAVIDHEVIPMYFIHENGVRELVTGAVVQDGCIVLTGEITEEQPGK